jgi:MFS family permease
MLALALVVVLLLSDAPVSAPRLRPRALLRALADNRMLAVPYAFAFVDRLTVGFIVSTFTLYLASVQGFAPPRIGLVMAAFMIPFALLTWPAGLLSRHWDRLGMMMLGSVLYGVFLVVLGLAQGDWIMWTMAAGGVVAALMYAPSLVLATELAGPGQRASTLAGFNVAGSLGFALGPLLGGLLVGGLRDAGYDPYQPVFVIVALTEVILALAMLPLWLRLRRSRGIQSSQSPVS